MRSFIYSRALNYLARHKHRNGRFRLCRLADAIACSEWWGATFWEEIPPDEV